MAVEKIHIKQFLELAKHHPVIDVRSPGEYNHAHLPGAHNLPLFTDEERKVVGTTYKQQSREAAIKTGLDYFGPKMKRMVEEVESIVNSHESLVKSTGLTTKDSSLILVYCWRGGMRSGAVSWLLDMYGLRVYTLTGGYKKFRNQVLDIFNLPLELNIVGGYTGSGKTEALKALREKGESVIDLEAIANHKGSAFGSIGMPKQPTQEMFENLLAIELSKSIDNPSTDAQEQWAIGEHSDSPFSIHHSRLWLEDESQRIGLVNIPNGLWNNMRKSVLYFMDIPFEERLKHITEEYGSLEKQKLIDAIDRIREKLGGLNAKMAIQLLEEENTLESFRILLNYYDKFYLKALHNRDDLNSLLQRLECKSVTPENASQLILRSKQQPEKV